jgi:hypothetical protein
LRNRTVGGDSTSKIFENKIPRALPGESQKTVNILFKTYLLFYGIFDRVIYFLDANAYKVKKFPNWFMTGLSIYGLGFQLLLIAILLASNNTFYILPLIASLTIPVIVCILIRKTWIK